MEAPYEIQTTTDGAGRTYVAFASHVVNRGPGALKVVGRRQTERQGTMTAEQILLTDGSVETGVPATTVPAGRLKFSPSRDHNHWHLLRFEDYMLLSVPDLDFVAPTRKTGFCLAGLNQSFWCGSQHPEFLEIGGDSDYALTPNPETRAMGMIAENGNDEHPNRRVDDIYTPSVEGQDIEITSVPSGRYCLSFVANPENRLVEERYANNGASRLVDVSGTPGGERTVALPRGTAETPTGFPASATCGLTTPTEPPARPGSVAEPLRPLTRGQANRLALHALQRKFTRLRGVRRSCALKGPNTARCRVSLTTGASPYSGRLSVWQRLRAGEAQWFYRVDVRRTRRMACRPNPATCPARVRSPTLLGGVIGAQPVAARRLLRLRPGPPATDRPGAAWPRAALSAESLARARAYRPVGATSANGR